MNNNKGFISFSLVLLLFLAFLSILAALLSNYLTTHRIITRYNESVEENINSRVTTYMIIANGNHFNVEYRSNNDILSSYFVAKHEANCLDEDGNSVSNTSTLSVGTHTITCWCFGESASTEISIYTE